MSNTGSAKNIVFYWDNFGPMHAERCDKVAQLFSSDNVIGLELFSRSSTYDWTPGTGLHFSKVTLFQHGDQPGALSRFASLLRASRKIGRGYYFLCNYQNPDTAAFAYYLRASGSRVILMNDSKFDDYPRYMGREVLKRAFTAPYQAALSSGFRSKDYLRFLGIPNDRIAGEYNTLSISRVRGLARSAVAPMGPPLLSGTT